MTWFVSARFFCCHGVRISQKQISICSRTQYVVMSELHCVVDLRLSEPGLFIPWGEDLDGHILPHPGAPPHLPIPAFTCKPSKENDKSIWVQTTVEGKEGRWLTNTLHQRDLSCHGPLDQVWKPGPTPWCTEFIIDFLLIKVIFKFRIVNTFSWRYAESWWALTPYVVSSPLGTFSGVKSRSSMFFSLKRPRRKRKKSTPMHTPAVMITSKKARLIQSSGRLGTGGEVVGSPAAHR